MAKIQCPRDYNYWYILSYAGVDPSKENNRWTYDEEKEELIAEVEQETLDNALNQYDHQAWLKELDKINNPKTKEQILEERLKITEDALLGLMDIIMMGGM
ncbi:hypothetical protein CACET_c15780 [Clostridium aceticum]|uniref:Uncharacterized protein n=1 Tax=Clostridium aceticum TaxID=84022 RepID=A0A0D8IFG0_9CLOT|nr:hypothetical protein [Clostridium aceticum]AKL95027.1 hypothetical protein CACET_c15780 [Clostridium aceticum]KJF27921.1 hypothetical protein TZ02_04945 [Clostridium aceticum]